MGSQRIRYERYGDSVNATFSKDIIKATYDIETSIMRGPASYTDEPFYLEKGPVAVRVIFTGQGQISREVIFMMVDQWRLYAGHFGARELAFGEIGTENPRAVDAAFSIQFIGL